MKHLLSILLICSIGFTQELTVEGDLNVTGNIQNQTIDSLLQVIQSLESQLSVLQGGLGIKKYTFNMSLQQQEWTTLNLNELTGYDLDWYKFEILFFSEGSGNAYSMFVEHVGDSNSRGNYFVQYNNGMDGWDIQGSPNSNSPIYVVDENPSVQFYSNGGDLSFQCTVLLTSQFPSESNVQLRKPGLQSKNKETVK